MELHRCPKRGSYLIVNPKWAASTPEPTRDEFGEWLTSQYNVTEKTMGGYLQVVLRLGALESQGSGRLTLTRLGEQILETEGEAKAKLVAEHFMQHYLAFPEILTVYAHASGTVHLKEIVQTLQPRFPRWTSDAQFEYRALWLLSLGCLRQERGRYYEITNFGRSIAVKYPPSTEIQAPSLQGKEPEEPSPDEPSPEMDDVSRLIAELEEATTDSGRPERLERAVAQAFEFLGFSVDQLGESGETDVLVRAGIGPGSYSAVVDAKSRGSGKLQMLSDYTLQEHRKNNEADYAVGVAGQFAGGKVVRQARDSGIVLLGVPILSAWLRLHTRVPLNLGDYRAIFERPGLLDDLPAAVKSAVEERTLWANLLVDLVELIRETYEHGLNRPLPSNQLFTMLVTRLRGVRYPEKKVEKAVALLTHPAISAALEEGDAGTSLAVSRQTLARIFRALADQIETTEAETQE